MGALTVNQNSEIEDQMAKNELQLQSLSILATS